MNAQKPLLVIALAVSMSAISMHASSFEYEPHETFVSSNIYNFSNWSNWGKSNKGKADKETFTDFDGNNGHGNDEDRCDSSNPGKSPIHQCVVIIDELIEEEVTPPITTVPIVEEEIVDTTTIDLTTDEIFPVYEITLESDNGVVLEVNTPAAYARGLTGKGSTIMIMDTGFDTDHVDLVGKVKYSWTPGYDGGMEDTHGHGTHVASIAAGRRNDLGTHGVAYDADLAIARISDTGRGMYYALGALDWAKDKDDIVVANLSSNTNYSNDYLASVQNPETGIYTSDHIYYGGANYYNLEDVRKWQEAMPSELVLTVSAGNSNLGYVQNPATFATAEDADGNLLLGGRMVAVGNYNMDTQQIEGAKAGHVCKDYTTQCNDNYRTSDFYILAPGTSIKAAKNDGDWGTMSGTSMAAPAVAGGFAILHQLWPYMKGENLVKVMLITANKDLPNYDLNTHGQGLMNLDKATQPIGDLGISTTGRTGNANPITGSIVGIDMGPSAVNAVSNITAVDSYDRDFKVNLTPLVSDKNTMSMKYLSHQKTRAWSSKFTDAKEYKTGNFIVSLNEQSQSLALGYSYDLKDNLKTNITYSKIKESPWTTISGIWGNIKDTKSIELNTTYTMGDYWLQGGAMISSTNFEKGLVTNINDIKSYYAILGYNREIQNNKITTYLGLQPKVYSSGIDFTLPATTDASGTMIYSQYSAEISSKTIAYIGADYLASFDNTNFSISGQVNTLGNYRTTVNYKIKF
ncbi:MAG: S8 family serine peptidase [Gammaproteobacteria bacterium]|nr:S8 family serine peptidase [Gammaproteobacteria bacterium]